MNKNQNSTFTGGLLTALAFSLSPSAQAVECTIDLNAATHTCGSIPSISVLSLSNLSAANADSAANDDQALVKITLNPVTTPRYTQALFTLYYAGTPTGWTVNIGDSPSNDGWAGDAANFSNDAEMQILNSDMSVYGNDYTPPGRSLLLSAANFVKSGETPIIKVMNNHLEWNSLTAEGGLTSPYLYGLGQPDNEGKPNYDIYAAFNRVISGRPDRVGSGLAWVRITLM